MEGSYTKFRYLKWNGIQDLICFLVNYFFAGLEAVLKVFQSLLYEKGDQNIHLTHSKSVNVEFPFDPGLLTFPTSYVDSLQSDEPKERKLILQLLYMPLHLVKFQIGINLLFCLLFFMLFLQIMIYIYQDLTVNVTMSTPSNMCRMLRLF